jgi:hypothetical protein
MFRCSGRRARISTSQKYAVARTPLQTAVRHFNAAVMAVLAAGVDPTRGAVAGAAAAAAAAADNVDGCRRRRRRTRRRLFKKEQKL